MMLHKIDLTSCFPTHPSPYLCKYPPISYIQTAAACVNCLCSGQLAVSKTSATGQLITMVHVVMHLVADDGNYPYAYKVDLEKIDLRDEKWTSELLHDCLLKMEKTFLTDRVA